MVDDKILKFFWDRITFLAQCYQVKDTRTTTTTTENNR